MTEGNEVSDRGYALAVILITLTTVTGIGVGLLLLAIQVTRDTFEAVVSTATAVGRSFEMVRLLVEWTVLLFVSFMKLFIWWL